VNEWTDTREWLLGHGFAAQDEALWTEALTHGSMGDARDYQRLEFLGDRVLGLTIAEWLFETQKGAAEGALAQRLNALVSKRACARVARAIGVSDHLRLGRQAREDGAADSDNILGDVMESLLGAQLREAGFENARRLIRDLWAEAVEGDTGRAKHPKSALQEWAAGNRRRPPNTPLSIVPAPITRRASPCVFRCATWAMPKQPRTASRRPRRRRQKPLWNGMASARLRSPFDRLRTSGT